MFPPGSLATDHPPVDEGVSAVERSLIYGLDRGGTWVFVVNEDAGDSDFRGSSFSAPALGRTTNAQPKLMVVLCCYAVAGAPEVPLGTASLE